MNNNFTCDEHGRRLVELMTRASREYNFSDAKRKEAALLDFLRANMDVRLKDVYLAERAHDTWEWRRRDHEVLLPGSDYQLSAGKRWADPPVPRHVVLAIPVDHTEAVLFHKRSERCRSARGVWSFPTGILELGETIRRCAERELMEENELPVLRTRVLGAYESIAPEDRSETQVEQYHWVFTVVGCLVPELRLHAKNLEPDKHERMTIGQLSELADLRFWMVHSFHPSFDQWGRSNSFEVIRLLKEMVRE